MSEENPILGLRTLCYGAVSTFTISAMAELKIADAIAAGDSTADTIAQRLDLDSDALARLLRYLASIEILQNDGHGGYSLLPMGEMLKTDVAGSFNGMAQVFGTDSGAVASAKIAHSIRTGEIAFNAAHGMGIFDYLQTRDAERQLFYSAFTGLSQYQAPVIADAFDFQTFDSIVDVGGGYGYLLLEILKVHDHPSGILYDLDRVVADARPLIESEGLADRCEAIAGDFFKSVPSGADAYVMKLIIHDWDDEQSVAILSQCRAAMANDGRVIVVDMVIPSDPPYGHTLVSDLTMMVVTGGRERTREEFESLCEKSGLQLVSVTPTSTMLSILEMAAT